jgi:hypothetical protein
MEFIELGERNVVLGQNVQKMSYHFGKFHSPISKQ